MPAGVAEAAGPPAFAAWITLDQLDRLSRSGSSDNLSRADTSPAVAAAGPTLDSVVVGHCAEYSV